MNMIESENNTKKMKNGIYILTWLKDQTIWFVAKSFCEFRLEQFFCLRYFPKAFLTHTKWFTLLINTAKFHRIVAWLWNE